MNKWKDDGTDLCCLMSPIRVCLNCGRRFCNIHWWDPHREKEGLHTIPQLTKDYFSHNSNDVFKNDNYSYSVICPNCHYHGDSSFSKRFKYVTEN